MNKVVSTKFEPVFHWLVLQKLENRSLFTIGEKMEHFNQNLQNLLFYQLSQLLYDVMQKEIETFEFVRGINYEFIDSLKNNGTKYLLTFDDSCEDICNSKAFVDTATADRHGDLSTIYIKQPFSPEKTRKRR